MADFVEEEDLERMEADEAPYPEIPSGGEDWEGAAAAKEKASDAKSSGDYALAIEEYTKALSLGSSSALLLANRAECSLKLRKPNASIADCNAALDINPDSAKALRCRGKANRFLGNWVESTRDLSAAQRIDFDPDVETLLRFVTQKAAKVEAKAVQARLEEEKKLRERLERRKREIEEARREAAAAAAAEEEEARQRGGFPGGGFPGGGFPGGGFPGGGFPGGGFPGGGDAGGMQQLLMQLLMSDPELAAGLQNPKMMAAFASVMSSGGPQSPAAQEALRDPEVKAFMDKVMKKLGPILGMMGGGGMGGMGGMGGFPGDEGGDGPGFDDDGDEGDGDDLPDLEETDGPTVEEID